MSGSPRPPIVFLAVGWLGVLFWSPQAGSAGKCLDEVTAQLTRAPEDARYFRPELDQTLDHDTYEVTDPDEYEFHLMASNKEDSSGTRRIWFSVKSRLEDGTRSDRIWAAREFRAALRHFEGQYDGIVGNWSDNPSFGDNLAQFNAALRENPSLTPEEAAKRTWTGKQALQAGCTQVTVRELVGPRGRYAHAEVHFDFPKPRSRVDPPARYTLQTHAGDRRPYYRAEDRALPDADRPDAFARAQLVVSERLLVLSIADHKADGSPSSKIIADEQFAQIQEYFKGRYDRIEVLVEEDDPFNLRQVNQGVTAGSSVVEAVRRSALGRLVLDAGFTRSRRGQVRGIRGDLEFVSVVFERP